MIRDPDALRVVWLFSKSYWWQRVDGRLTLAPVALPTEQPSMSLDEAVARMFNHPFPWPPEGVSGA